MLAQRGGRRAHTHHALRVLDRRTDHLDIPTRVVLDLGDHTPGLDMLVLQRILDVVDGRVRQTTAFQDVQPLLCCFLRGEILNQLLQNVPILDPHVVRHESLVRLPLRPPELVADDPEETVVASAQHDVAIGRLESFVRHDRRMRRTPASTVALAADEYAAGDVGERGHLAVGQRHVEVLAPIRLLSGEERGHDRIARVQSRCEVGDRHADLDGRPVAFAGDVHEAHFRFDHNVVARARAVGARLAVPCY